jgi:hypothetical protein
MMAQESKHTNDSTRQPKGHKNDGQKELKMKAKKCQKRRPKGTKNEGQKEQKRRPERGNKIRPTEAKK